jgi:uncharacterized protein YndB with AHSA1/START domain
MTTATELVTITRVFDAPREAVFRAWTVPEEIAAWYGPDHFDSPAEKISVDLRVGGRWVLTMVQRDNGAEFTLGYDIVELVEPELLVLRSDPMHEFGITTTRVELYDEDGKTRMVLTDGPYPGGFSHAERGWNQAFEKLARCVAR